MTRIRRGGCAPDAMRTLGVALALAGSTTSHAGLSDGPALTACIRDCILAPLTARARSTARTTPKAAQAKATTQ